MPTPKDSSEGCLSVLSSCFKTRGKRQPVDAQTSRPTSNVVTADNALPPRSEIAQQPASTPQSIGDTVSEPAKTDRPSSAIAYNEPTSTPPDSNQKPSTTKSPEAGLDLWQEAYSATEENTQKWIRENFGEWSENTDPFPELVELVRGSEKKHDQEALQFKFHGRVVILRDYTSRVTSCMTTIGDIGINFAPAPSPIIWNALKVVLKASVSQVADVLSIMGCTNLVLSLVRRGIVYQEVYLRNLPLGSAQKDLKEKLVSVYKSCLEFLVFVHGELKQGNLDRLLKALVDPGKGEQRLSEVKTLEQQLEVSARACEAEASDTRNKEHRDLLKSLQLPLKRIDEGVVAVLAKLEEAERIGVMDYLSTIPVGSHHNEKCNSRAEGTGEWLVDHSFFQEWEDSNCSSIFWLQGNMGTGKSYLSSKVIDRYLVREEDQKGLTSQHDEGFAFFYCYRSDPSRRDTASILRSYIRQLSEVPRRPDRIHQASLDLMKSTRNIQHSLTIANCRDTLVEIINSYPRVTLVLDALDECDNETICDLAQVLRNLVEESEGLVKVFVASRKEPDIDKCLRPIKCSQWHLLISTSHNAGDIERFIENEISAAIGWDFITEDTKRLVQKTLVEKSNGMFRWAYLQWQQLKRCRMNDAILRRLDQLPETLSAAYDEIYNRFGPDDPHRLMLQRAIRWVLCAKKPLETVSLLAAIEAESKRLDQGAAFHKSDLTELTLEWICQDLLVRDYFSRWAFPHASVAEYFVLQGEPWIENAKCDIAISLTHFLIDCCAAFGSVWPPPEVKKLEIYRQNRLPMYRWFESKGVNVDEPLDPRHPLQTYTQQQWLNHLSDISEQDSNFEDLSRVLKLFLGKEGPRESSAEYRVFCRYFIWFYDDPYRWMRDCVEPSANSTFGIIALGLCRLLPGWWDQDLDPSELNARGEDLLVIAAYVERLSICKDLVRRGFDINRSVNQLVTPLGTAILYGTIDIVRWFLDNGANPNLDIREDTLLCLAAQTGPVYVQAMLEAGASPNKHCEDCEWVCALSMAAWEGDISSVESLIEAGAELNPKFANPDLQSPLEWSVMKGMTFGVEDRQRWLCCTNILLEHGADANAPVHGYHKGRTYDSLLEAAVAGYLPASARLLVEHGADINTPLKIQGYDTILEFAVEKGDVDFTQLLIERGADVHSPMKIGKYGSLLAAATLAPDSSLDMVKFLIEDAHLGFEQLEWSLPPQEKPITRVCKLSEEQERSRAKRAEYLIDVHKVNPQVLIDLKS